jgi:hypothetical protein
MSEARQKFISGVAARRAEYHGRPRRHFYSAELRSLALEHARVRSASGVRVGEIAHELGLYRDTLLRWQRRGGESARAARPARLRRVRVIAGRTPSAEVEELVVTAGPLTVRGLSVEALVQLVRELT